MPIYEYRCPECATRVTSTSRANTLPGPCHACAFPGPLRRVFSFAFKPIMHSHFNNTVGKPISDIKQFRSELSRKSDEATEQTGIPHNFQPIEAGDHAALGATNEGIGESNVRRRERGESLLPDVGS